MAVTKGMCDWIQVHEKLSLEEDCPSLFEHNIVGYVSLHGMETCYFRDCCLLCLLMNFQGVFEPWIFTVEMLAVSWKRCGQT